MMPEIEIAPQTTAALFCYQHFISDDTLSVSSMKKWCKKNYPCQKCADHKIQALDVFWAYFINGA